MKKEITKNKYFQLNKGSSLLEVLLSIAVFTIGIFTLGLFMIDILHSTQKSQDINQALLIVSGNDWVWGSDEEETSDETNFGEYGKTFTRVININEISGDAATNTVQSVTSTVTWPATRGEGEVILRTYMTNWER
jgi:Tfp pilus assembly protein PilV